MSMTKVKLTQNKSIRVGWKKLALEILSVIFWRMEAVLSQLGKSIELRKLIVCQYPGSRFWRIIIPILLI